VKKILLLFLFGVWGVLYAGGQVMFERTYGDTGEQIGVNVIQTFDGGFMITADNVISNITHELYIIKTDSTGDTLWTRAYQLDSGRIGNGIQTSDSGYAFTGGLGLDFYLFRINSSGDSLWTRRYNFSSLYGSTGKTLIETSDHYFMIVGQIFIGTSVCCSPIYMRADSIGNLIWYSSNGLGRVYEIMETEDGNFVISKGQILSGPPYPIVSKITRNDSAIWTQGYSQFSCECSFIATPDGGYALSGTDFIGGSKPSIFKIDSIGTFQWKRGFSNFNSNARLAPDADSGYVMTGRTYPNVDLLIFKAKANGDSLWIQLHGGNADDEGGSIIKCNDGGFAIVGYTKSYGAGNKDVYFIKTNSLGMVTSVKTFELNHSISIYPNPTTSTFTIETQLYSGILEVYDILGERVHYLPLALSSWRGEKGEVRMNISVQPGIYFVRVSDGERVATQKLVVSHE
jgi:hypothetical protein